MDVGGSGLSYEPAVFLSYQLGAGNGNVLDLAPLDGNGVHVSVWLPQVDSERVM